MAYVDLKNKTIAQYKMNDNKSSTVVTNTQAVDASYIGGANTVDRSIEGRINGALNFTGDPDYIDTLQTFENTFQDSFTINLWVRFSDISSIASQPGSYGAESLFCNRFDGNETANALITPSIIRFYYQIAPSATPYVETANTLLDNTWHMLTFIAQNNGSTMTRSILIDGVFANSNVETVNMGDFNSVFNFLIGVRLSNVPFPGNLFGHMVGDIDNLSIFNEVLSQDEVDFLYSNGFGTEFLDGQSGVDENTSPTLIYPIGGEQLTHETIQIKWEEPFLLSQGGTKKLYWYEIFYSIDSSSEENRLWHHLADIPSGNTVFNWKIPRKIRSNNCRVGIRVVDSEGMRSAMIMSSSVFSIRNKILPSPAVFSPLGGERFFTYIPIVFDQDGLSGQFPKRAHYRVSYTSASQESDWACIGDNIPITTSETFLDVSNLISADDYSLKFELIDGDDSSQPFFIHDITINNLNFFKIDTVPPVGLISVRNNSEYIKNRDTIVELTAYDATTGVESFKITQKELDYFDGQGENIITEGPLNPMSNISSWRVVKEDGIKLLQVSFVDFAGNTVEPVASEFFFRTYKNVDNREVTSILVNKDGSNYDVWHALGGVDPELYLNGGTVVGAEATGTLNYLPTSSTSHGLSIQRYDVEGLGSIDVHFFPYEIPDRLVIEGGGNVLKDTGLMSGQTSFNLSVVGLSEIIVKVTSQNAGTLWAYEIDSKDEYPITSDFYDTAASKDKPAGEILSMAMYNGVLYLGEEIKEAKGLLQRYTGGHIESVYEIPTLDSAINAMVVFDAKLFLACENGELYSFNGTTVQIENTFESALNEIGTDGNLLYIYMKNSSDIYTAYKDIYGDLNYVKTTLE